MARTRHFAFIQRTHHRPRRDDRFGFLPEPAVRHHRKAAGLSRKYAGEPEPAERLDLFAARDAGVGGQGHEARRRVQTGAAQRDESLGGRRFVPRPAGIRRRRDGRDYERGTGIPVRHVVLHASNRLYFQKSVRVITKGLGIIRVLITSLRLSRLFENHVKERHPFKNQMKFVYSSDQNRFDLYKPQRFQDICSSEA